VAEGTGQFHVYHKVKGDRMGGPDYELLKSFPDKNSAVVFAKSYNEKHGYKRGGFHGAVIRTTTPAQGVAEGNGRDLTNTPRDQFISRMTPSMDANALRQKVAKIVNSPGFTADTILQIVDAGDNLSHPAGRYIQQAFYGLQYNLGKEYEDYPERVAEKLLSQFRSMLPAYRVAEEETPFGSVSVTNPPSNQKPYAEPSRQDIWDKNDLVNRQAEAREQKQLTLRYARKHGRQAMENLWAERTDVRMRIEEILEFLDATINDPGLTPEEFMGTKGLDEGSGQDSKSWMASIRQQHPDVRFVQAKMPGAPIIALVNGKPVAQWDGKQQGELPLQEKKRSDRESNATVGDTKVARELQKLRAQYPAARNDVEVVAKSEIDSNERSQQQLAAINGANTEQDQLLKQLVALDKQQGKEIGSLDNENDRLEQQLKHVEQTNAKLAQAIDQIAGETPSKGADDAGPTRSKSVNLAPADAPAQPQAKREPSDSTPKSDAINRMARDLTQPKKVKGTNQGNVTNLDAFRRAQAAVTNKDFNPMIKAMLDKGVLSRTGTDDRLNEFAPSAGGGSGNYFQALASAWYNGAFDTGSLEKGIKSKEDVERLLNRGIIGPDGKTRKYAIDYNSTFEGVVISSDDYYEHSDYNDQGQEVDSRNGRPWGPYDYMEFDD
jgi:hypothetical protein